MTDFVIGGQAIPRAIRRSGVSSVIREGFPRRIARDFFHSLLQRKWSHLILTILLFILFSNAAFASVYYFFDLQIANAESWWDRFFFSVQTMATVGYGHIAPIGIVANFVAALESIYGLMAFGVVAGLVFAKFSRPTSKLIFSEVAVITRRNGKLALMFRMVNERNSQIIDGKINVSLLRNEISTEGDRLRSFVDVPLVRSHTPIFALTFTAVHIIDEHSPFCDKTIEQLANEAIEIIVVFSGVDEIFSQTIYARHSYILDEIRWEHRFQDILGINEDGRRVIHFSKFHETEPHRSDGPYGVSIGSI